MLVQHKPTAGFVAKTEGFIPPLLRLVKITIGLTALAFGANYLNAQTVKLAGISLVWLSNGFLIGSLLCSIRRQWPALLVLGLVVDLTLNFASGGSVPTSLTYSISNMIEVSLGAWLMYPAVAKDPDLTDARQLSSFLLFGAVVAPAVTSFLVTVYLRLHSHIPFSSSVRFWFAADFLGIALITPLYLSWHHRIEFSRRSTIETIVLFLLLCGVTFAVFRMTTYPMLWFVLLFLLLLGVRVGFTGAALGLLAVMCIGGYLTSTGYGPLSQGAHESLKTRVLTFQSFIALSMIALYVTEAAMSANQRILLRLEASEDRFRSLAEASRDLIVLADLRGEYRYVSPAVTEMLGWASSDLIDNPRQITHPDDLEKFSIMLDRLRLGDHVPALAYQCLRKDGSYLWLEASARLMRDETTNVPSGFVYVLRDISDRRAAEEKMQEAFRIAERQAMRDGLTGVANRRLLDKTLRSNWQRGARDKTPLSLAPDRRRSVQSL